MIQNILKGLQVYTGTYSLISKLKLWKYFVIPMLISLAVFILIFASAYGLSDDLGEWISAIWQWDFGKVTFTAISTFISGIILFALGLIMYKHIIMALSSPFMSPVSEKIEKHFYGDVSYKHRNTSNTEQLIRGLRLNIRNLIKELLISLPILLLKFIPIVNIFSTLLLFLVQAYYAGFGNIDYTLERHLKYKESIEFVSKNKGFAIGNGIVFMLFLLIPIVGIIIVLPLSVTAASTKTLKLIHGKTELVYEK